MVFIWSQFNIIHPVSPNLDSLCRPAPPRQLPLCLPCRQKPYVIRSPRRRLAVEVQLENRLENAYNTSLTLQYSRNLHFSSLSVKVTQSQSGVTSHL